MENNSKDNRHCFSITLPAIFWERLERLAAQLPADENRTPLEALIADLLDHAQQGVYRPEAWEHEWLVQAFGPAAVEAADAPPEDPGSLLSSEEVTEILKRSKATEALINSLEAQKDKLSEKHDPDGGTYFEDEPWHEEYLVLGYQVDALETELERIEALFKADPSAPSPTKE